MNRRVLATAAALAAAAWACSDSTPTATAPEAAGPDLEISAARVDKPKSDREVVRVSRQLEPWGGTSFFVDCPEGKSVIGGGYEFAGDEVVVFANRPMPQPYEAHRWTVGFVNPSDTKTYTVEGWAICMTL